MRVQNMKENKKRKSNELNGTGQLKGSQDILDHITL
jgi:hypothetical protein